MERKDRKSSLFLLFVGISLFYGGCSSVKPRIGFELTQWEVKELGGKIQTTPVHSDDSGFLTGRTITNLDGDKTWDVAPKAGLLASIGDDNLRFNIGADIRYNPLSHKDDYHEGLYDWRQQVSDTRPPSQGSFVFTQLTPDYFTYIPFVGVERKLSERLCLGFEVGFPYMQWEVRSGHDRWGRWETVQRDSWSGFGMRYTGNVLFKINENGEFFISPFYEQYNPEFAGQGAKIRGLGLFLGVGWRF